MTETLQLGYAAQVLASPLPRRTILRTVAFGVLAIALSACLTANQQVVHDRINHSRTSAGLAALPTDADATKRAQAWAEELAARGSLSHSDIASAASAGNWARVAENVGRGSNEQSVHENFLSSSSHRANMLDAGWTHMGVGMAEGNGSVFVVHIFIEKG